MLKKSIGVILLSAFFALSASFAAEPNEKGTNANFSDSYIPVKVGTAEFFYRSGVFYKKNADTYIAVESPRGAVIQSLPVDHTVVMVKKKTYYYCNDTYYTSSAGGYMVVSSPFASQTASAPAPASAPAAQPTANSPSNVQQTTTTTTTTVPTVIAPVYPTVVRVAPAPIVRNPDSQNPIKKLGRGIFCAVFAFMEIPINMADIAKKEGPPQALSYGFFKGVGFFIFREVVASVEVATFPIPLPGTVEDGVRDWGYGPLLEPEWIFPVR